MSRLKKLNAFLITLIFSHSALAVVIEGSITENAVERYPERLTGKVSSTDIYTDAKNLDIASQLTALHSNSLTQNLHLLPSSDVYDNIVSYSGLEAIGVASRADYHGWMAVNLSATKVNSEETVTVPEPSPLLLLVGPLLLLVFRAGVFTKNSLEIR